MCLEVLGILFGVMLKMGLDTAVHGPNSDLLVSISAIGQVSEGLLSIGMRFHTRYSPAHA